MTNSIAEIEDANFILAIGTNTTETHPIIGLKIKKAVKKGTVLAVIDPRSTEIAKLAAERHLAIAPGSDLAILNSLAHVIIEEGLYNRDFVEKRTEGFEELKKGVEKYSPEYTEKISGIPAEVVRQLAGEYASAEKASILYTMGVTQHITGTDNVLAVANLALLTGQIGRPATGVNPLRGQNNVQGACDVGALPDVYPGYQKVNNPQVRGKFEKAWGVNLNSKPGLTSGEMFKAALNAEIKSMYIIGENPVLSDPDANHVIEALQMLDFLVVQDIFLTETARFADVVLPAASFAEKDGTFTNTERRVQRVHKAIAPVGQSRADWQIIQEIANRMGYAMDYAEPSEIMDEIARVTPIYGGINYQRLAEQNTGLQWPCPDINHSGTKYLHAESFANGRGKLTFCEYIPSAEQPDQEYPLLLTTGRKLWHYHTGTMTRKSTGLVWKLPQERIEINPKQAEEYNLRKGDYIRLTSRRGSVEASVEITDRVSPGLIFGTFHFSEVPINRLTGSAVDPKAKIPGLKVTAVKIEKL